MSKINEEIGEVVELNEIDIQTIDNINNEVNKLNKVGVTDITYVFFSFGKRCGFAASGDSISLVNANTRKSCKVTIKTTYRSADQREVRESEKIHILKPKGKVYLGCTRGGGIGSGTNQYIWTRVEWVKSK